ncbi:unnamed protein product [Camellia sinensis]
MLDVSVIGYRYDMPIIDIDLGWVMFGSLKVEGSNVDLMTFSKAARVSCLDTWWMGKLGRWVGLGRVVRWQDWCFHIN